MFMSLDLMFFWVKTVQNQEIFGTKNGRFRVYWAGNKGLFYPSKDTILAIKLLIRLTEENVSTSIDHSWTDLKQGVPVHDVT